MCQRKTAAGQQSKQQKTFYSGIGKTFIPIGEKRSLYRIGLNVKYKKDSWQFIAKSRVGSVRGKH